MQKRIAFKLALAGAMALMLSACGDKTEAPQPAKTADAPKTAETAQGPLKIAFVYVSPASEEGWSRQHDLARQELEKEFGDKIKVTTVENIPAGADSERVLRDLAQQGNKLIFATSFGYMNSVLKVAKEFPDVKFEHATGYKTAAKAGIIDKKVIALGGIDEENLLEVKDFGFGGAAILGALWNKFDACTDRDYRCVIEHFRKLRDLAD